MSTNPRSILAVVVACIGAGGQGFLLRQDLVDCYPYKMLSYPSSAFCSRFGNAAIPIMSLLVLVFGLYLLRRHVALAPMVFCFGTPVLIAISFVLALRVWYPGPVPIGLRNFDGYTLEMVRNEFLRSSVCLALAGLIVGGIFSSVLKKPMRRAVEPKSSSH